VKREKAKGQAIIELIGNIVIFSVMIALVATLSSYLYLQHVVLTAAREGARTGALSNAFAQGNDSQGITEVQDAVRDFMAQSAGQSLTSDNSTITVTPPQDEAEGGVFGQRSVTVNIEYELTNPVPIADFIEGLTGGSYENLRKIPISAEASMRFEE
jgi:Flp pilus assembly protein TadG